MNIPVVLSSPPAGLLSVQVEMEILSLKYRPYISYLAVFVVSTLFFLTLAVFYFVLTVAEAYIFAVNTSAIILYAYDKNIAGSNAVRIPEKVLYVMAALGSAIGILIGIRLFRHKSRKAKFQFVLAVIFSCQLALYLFWYRT